MSAKKAVVLVSGGLDSATTLAIAINEGFCCYALTCMYGQRHDVELEAAKRVVQSMGAAAHQFINLDLSAFGGSALTDSHIEVPKERSAADIGTGIPVTYVPARNTVFLSLALAWAESLGAFDIFIGVNAMDYSGYPDCRPEFIRAFEEIANLATAAGTEGRGRFHIHTPIIQLTKGEVVQRGLKLGVDYSLTHSCYDPDSKGHSCGRCDACLLRLKGFAEAKQKDRIPYRNYEGGA